MKTNLKKFLTLLFIDVLLNSTVIAQPCGIDIVGPHSFCNANPTANFTYSFNLSVGSTIQWFLLPTGGVIASPTASTTSISWATAPNVPVKLTATMTTGTTVCTSELWIQPCCSPTNISVHDIDDPLNQLPLFLPVSNCTPTNNKILVHGTVSNYYNLSIQGYFNVAAGEEVYFEYCNLEMGPGSDFTTFISGATCKLSFNHCNISAMPACSTMWKGINPGEDAGIYILNSTLKDAQYGTGMAIKNIVQLVNDTFERNYITFYEPPVTYPNAIINRHFLGGSLIEGNTFNGQPQLFQPFAGQTPLPVNQKSYAGIYLNNDSNFVTSSNPNALGPNEFHHLATGIEMHNCIAKIYHCLFHDMNNDTYHTPASGVAMYADRTTNLWIGGAPSAIIGGVSTSQAIKWNQVDNCIRGVYAVNGVSLTVNNNSFSGGQNSVYCTNNRNQTISHNSFANASVAGVTTALCSNSNITVNDNNVFTNCYIGCDFAKVQNSNLNVSHNTFTFTYLITGNFANTGIKVYNGGVVPTNLTISNNKFYDPRIGIYMINVQSPPTAIALIESNEIHMNTPYGVINNNGQDLVGIQLYNCPGVTVDNNIIDRTSPITNVLVPNAISRLRGMYISGSNVSGSILNNHILFNYIHNMGSGMYYTAECRGTQMLCNQVDVAVQGVHFNLANMSPQGTAAHPFDNSWTNFPIAPGILRVGGQTKNLVPIAWFYKGTTSSNAYSCDPASPQAAVGFPNAGGPYICQMVRPSGDTIVDPSLVESIVNDYIEYIDNPEVNRYYDRVYAYRLLNEDDSLRNSNPDLQQFYLDNKGGNIGQFTEADSLARLGLWQQALDLINSLTDSNQLEYNKRITMQIELQHQISGEQEYNVNERNILIGIAQQSVFTGGEGVYNARAMLDTLVDDTLTGGNYRIANNTMSVLNTDYAVHIYPNPAAGNVNVEVNLNEGDILHLIITDIEGKQISEYTTEDKKINIDKLAGGVYLLHAYINNGFVNHSKITVLQ